MLVLSLVIAKSDGRKITAHRQWATPYDRGYDNLVGKFQSLGAKIRELTTASNRPNANMELYAVFVCVSGHLANRPTPVRKRVDVHHPHVFFERRSERKKGTAAKRLPNRENKGEIGVYWPSVDDITIMDDNSRF